MEGARVKELPYEVTAYFARTDGRRCGFPTVNDMTVIAASKDHKRLKIRYSPRLLALTAFEMQWYRPTSPRKILSRLIR
jgi:hypothetical protein